ncbi:MAG TPA: hypothetical protein VFY42_05070 [Gemmatimonadales bacterium]|nr:hypothetical protein [Gemmatimonadales bacterium]
MFVGHYGVSFAAKRVAPTIPLWVLFLAVQLLDIFWAPLILLGIEKVRIVPGITASNPFDLYYMPYTHSLLAALLWSAGALLVCRLFATWGRAGQAAFVVALAVFSHWILDFLVHRPDLPLYDNTAKVGLGLWNVPALAFALEAGLLFGGMWLYFGTGLVPRVRMLTFGLIMLAIQAYIFFGPPPASDKAAAWTALAAYALFAAAVARLERPNRASRE